MGRDKALLAFGGKKLIQRACELASSVTDSVTIIGPRDTFMAYGKVVEDIHPGRGPLGGIYSVLSHARTDLNLILAVDTPFIARDFLVRLRGVAEHGTAAATVPRINNRFQPLCAFYRKSFLPAAERALSIDQNKIELLFSQVTIRVIEEDEALRLGATPQMFANLNTPEEYEAALKSLNNR
jgi:molybdopterin-guanine dinucleotide biosynthesis protein A